MNWEDVIVDAAATDTGMRRSNNQDSHAVVRASSPELWRSRGHLFMVADGMGAHAAGELASKLACDNIPHHYHKSRTGTQVEAITKAYREVGGLIYTRAKANPDFHNMGTTCSTLILLPTGALIAHVGDSRVYRIRQDRIDQLTFDHSLVWELVRRQHLSPDQASKAVPRNVITRSLGPDPTVEVDIEGPLPVEPGDTYLLCSDGLSGPVADPELGAFAAQFHPKDASRYLLHLANLRGGQDNITLVILHIGPWIEPGTADMATMTPKAKPARASLLSSLLGSFQRKPAAAAVEEHRYQSATATIDPDLIVRLTETVRNTQAAAVEQAWNLDWPMLAQHRRRAEEARAAGELRESLRYLGEAIDLLGLAGRIHRKEQAQSTGT